MFAAIYVPNFLLQAVLRFRPELWRKPAAIVDKQSLNGSVLEFTELAGQPGITKGITSTQALARCPRATLLSCSASERKAVSDILLELSCSLSAYVEQTRDDVCILDLQRIAIPDHHRWALEVTACARRLTLHVHIGIASNPDLALLAAQHADPVLIVSDPKESLLRLPIEALAPSTEAQSILQSWGIRHVGEFAQLPKEKVSERLGPEGKRMWEKASEKTPRLLKLVRPTEQFEETYDFEHEIDTLEPLLFILRRFLDQLSLRLRTCYRVAQTITLFLPLADRTTHERVFKIPAPTADAAVLFRIIDTYLEQLRLESGPVGIRLLIEPAKSQRQQFQLFENALRDPNQFGETLARIKALVGNSRVGRPEPAPTHQPDQFRLGAFEGDATKGFGVSQSKAVGLPLRRYRPPLPADVKVSYTKPEHIASERFKAMVTDAFGPYRLSGKWWHKDNAWDVEWWDIEVAGHGLYRLGKLNGSWFLEGCYDLATALC
jgi:protein ImuB